MVHSWVSTSRFLVTWDVWKEDTPNTGFCEESVTLALRPAALELEGKEPSWAVSQSTQEREGPYGS